MTPDTRHTPVYRDDLDKLGDRLEDAIKEAVTDTRNAIKESENAWRTRAHELATLLQAQQLAVALQDQRLKTLADAAKDEKEARAALWARVLIVTGMVASLVAWVYDKVAGVKP